MKNSKKELTSPNLALEPQDLGFNSWDSRKVINHKI